MFKRSAIVLLLAAMLATAQMEAVEAKTHKKVSGTGTAVLHEDHKPAAAKKELIETRDVKLQKGESVALEFGGHKVDLTLAENGSLVVDADNEKHVLPAGDSATVDIEGDVELESSSAGDKEPEAVAAPSAATKAAPQTLMEKFTELAVKAAGGSEMAKQAAPIVVICGLMGVIAAVIGVAVIAVDRVRVRISKHDAASVLTDVPTEEEAEDVDDVQALTEESAEDAAADTSNSLEEATV